MLKGTLVRLNEDGTALIKAQLPLGQVLHREVKEVYIDLIDSRPLSDKQRRMCYAMIKAIADWSGSGTEEVKQAFKLDFWAERVDTLADKIFSLSNAPMSLVAEFQRFLVAFILTNDIPTRRPLREYVDDIETYTYLCLDKAQMRRLRGGTPTCIISMPSGWETTGRKYRTRGAR